MTKKSNSPSSRNLRKNKFRGLQYENLEQRLPLDASFEFTGGVLTINNFTNDTALQVEAENGGLTATLNGEAFIGDRTSPGVTVNDTLDDAGQIDEPGDELTVTGVTSLVITSGNTSPSNLTFDIREALNLAELTVDVRGDIQFNSRGNDFNSAITRFTTTGNLTQTDNSAGVATNVSFGDLGFNVDGNVSFDSLSGLVVDPITGLTLAGGVLGGRAGEDLSIVASDGDLNFVDQFGLDSDNNGETEALFVGGAATINIVAGSVTQTESVVVGGDLNFINSGGTDSIDLSTVDGNNFNTINLNNPTPTGPRPTEFRIADRNAFTVENLQAEDVYLGAGRFVLPLAAGQLTLTGNVFTDTLAIQASGGLDQTTGSSILTQRLVLGGDSVIESSGDYIFNGSVEGGSSAGFIVLSPGDLQEIDVAFRVRGNLDLFTGSELNVIDTDLIFTDGRETQEFDTSYVDGDTRISANSIDFAVEFETTKFVLDLEADGTQTADSAILADQFYVSGTRIDFGSELNDANQIAGRASGDESFLRFFDIGTVRIVSLDGEIEGASADRSDLPVLNGVSTERFPQITIGEDSFIDLRTGLGGPVLNPRVGAPDIPLDDIETFEVVRDADILSFVTDEFGIDGRGTFFIEFIHDGVSPFEIVAQGFGFDAELALFDEVGNLVFAADDPVLNLNANITGDDFATPLPAGRYYIASAAFSATFADGFDVQTEFTPANQPTGTLLVTLDIGVPSEVVTEEIVNIQSTLNTGFSQDLRNFGFVLENDANVSIFTGSNNRPGTESAFDPQIFVFELNEDGTLGDFVDTDDDTGGGQEAFLNLSLTAGQYVTVVGEFELDEAVARLGVADAGQGGPFEITFAGVDGAVELAAGPLDPELTFNTINPPLIQPETATFLIPTELAFVDPAVQFDPALLSDPSLLVNGSSVTIAGSVDSGLQSLPRFGFVLNQDSVVTVFTGDETTPAADSDFDTEIAIFALNEDGTLGALAALNDDGGDGLDSSATVSLTAGNYIAFVGQFPFDDDDARSGSGFFNTGGDFEITFEGTDGVLVVEGLGEEIEERERLEILESFIAPEVRRSVFQDADAPIDTESLIISATEDGSVLIDSPNNRIDRISVIDTDDFTFDSSVGIVLDALNADGDVVLIAVEDITANNIDANGTVTIDSGADIFTSVVDADGVIDFTAIGNVTVSDLTVNNAAGIEFDDDGFLIVNSINSGGNTSLTNVDVDSSIDITSVGSVTVDGLIVESVDGGDFLVSSDLTIGSGENIFASNVDVDGFVDLSSGGTTSLQLVTTQSGLNSFAGNDILVDGVTAVGDVFLQAGDDIRLTTSNGIRRLVADNLTLVANNFNNDFNGIFLFTDVNSATASVQGSGQIFLNELTDITIGDLAAEDGPITLRANGSITGSTISVARAGSPITLVARGDDADINVALVSSPGSNDTIRLLADDDVFAGVSGGNLRVQAKNTVGDRALAVNLTTNVRSLSVDAGLSSNDVLNRGDISVVESNALLLTRAVTVNGRISVNAQGNLNAVNVQADGVTGDDVIQLSATGTVSDLTTSRVVVRNRLGGVVLRASDDIVDSNTSDNLQVVATRATYIAGNSQQDSFNGIIGQSFASTISASVNSTTDAGVFLFNSGNTVVEDSSVTNGRFSIINRTGVLRVDDVVVRSNDVSRIFLQTLGLRGDILLGNVDSGPAGLVTVDSADDVLDTAALDEFFVRGEFLGVTSRNNNSDNFDGILLNVDVDDISATALNGGQSFIRTRS